MELQDWRKEPRKWQSHERTGAGQLSAVDPPVQAWQS